MWRKRLLFGAGLPALLVVPLAGIVVSIGSDLQRFSDDAVARFAEIGRGVDAGCGGRGRWPGG
jgi:hypothetical protein